MSNRARRLVTPVAAVVLHAVVSSGCALAARRSTNSYGVASCPARAEGALLSVDALQCWFAAPHGRWRTLSHESHFDVLVVQVEAFDRRDAQDIARRFVEGERMTFSEILIYVRSESRDEPARIRRVRWTQRDGLETFDFVAPAARE